MQLKSWNTRATWQMPQYVTNVKSADLCQYDVRSTTASRTDFAAVRVFARKSTRNQMKIDSPDDRSARLHDYTRLPRLSALANRMSTADGQSVPPSLCFPTLNFALWECLTPFRGNSGTLNLASTLFIKYHSMENVSPKLIMRICCDIWQRTAFSFK